MASQINTITAAFSKRITIEKSVNGSTTTGKPIKSFQKIKDTFANVYIAGGATQYNDQYDNVKTTVTFTIRYDSNVDYDCRIVYNSRNYNIQFIEDIDVKRYLKITTYLDN